MSNLTVIYDSAYKYARKELGYSVKSAEIYADLQVKEYQEEEIEKLSKLLDGDAK